MNCPSIKGKKHDSKHVNHNLLDHNQSRPLLLLKSCPAIFFFYTTHNAMYYCYCWMSPCPPCCPLLNYQNISYLFSIVGSILEGHTAADILILTRWNSTQQALILKEILKNMRKKDDKQNCFWLCSVYIHCYLRIWYCRVGCPNLWYICDPTEF